MLLKKQRNGTFTEKLQNSIIGMNIEAAMKRFLTQIPERYSCAEGPFMLNGVVFNFDEISKKVTDITRISL